MKPIAAIELDTRRLIEGGVNAGKYHAKIRVTFCVNSGKKKKWIRKRYKTGCFVTPEEFAALGKSKLESLRRVNTKLKSLEMQANDIIEAGIEDIDTFEVHYLSTGSVREIDGVFLRKIKELEDDNKISTAEKYRTALSVIHEFSGPIVTYGEINLKWLKKFQTWYTGERVKVNKKGVKRTVPGRSVASFAFHCRALRHVFKIAMDLRLVDPAIYPFGPNRFVIPSKRRALKRYLTPEEKDLILEYKSTVESRNEIRDYWVFSYFCQGMNFADIAYLKRRDIHPEYISIDRHKTENTDPNKKKLIIWLLPEILDIIRRRGNKSLNPEDFVFPILNGGMTPKQRFAAIRRFVMRTNKGLRAIQKDLGFKDRITTYTARHTYSNVMILSGASTEFLQDALGHADKRTTENYKHGFSLDIKKKYSELL